MKKPTLNQNFRWRWVLLILYIIFSIIYTTVDLIIKLINGGGNFKDTFKF